MGVNDNALCLNERFARAFFASRLAPTEKPVRRSVRVLQTLLSPVS